MDLFRGLEPSELLLPLQNTTTISQVFLVTLITALGLETFKSATGWSAWTTISQDGGDQFAFKGGAR